MKIHNEVLILAIAATLTMAGAMAAESPGMPMDMRAPARPATPELRSKPKPAPAVEAPELEPMSTGMTNSALSTHSALSATTPSPESSTLSAPVTISYSGTSPVLQVNNSGTNKGLYSVTSNTSNGSSAIFGQTNGSGAGLTGYNSGTVGPAGKFGILNAESSQPGVLATTNGTGPALLATITTASSNEPAILGQNLTTAYYGIGVEGEGNDYGLYGTSTYAGVYGSGTSYGVIAETSSGTGLYAYSSSGDGLYAYSGSSYGAYIASYSGVGLYGYSSSNYGISAESDTGTALYANADAGGRGIVAHSASGIGVYSSSDTGYGIWGQSKDAYGVIGEDSGTGYGVYGYSATGYAGYFAGKVGATSYVTVSDRNVKTQIHPVDGKAILDKVTHMPVSAWVFKADPEKKHVGPMAQDFHAAFGLDGDDDKHINLTDIAGVSLASIQELSKQMKQKDAEIAELKQQLSAQTQAMAQMKSLTDTVSARMAILEDLQRNLSHPTQTASLTKQVDRPGE